MLRENWNFKADIAYPLERIACDYYGQPSMPSDKIYHSDIIGAGTFVEVMILLLRHKSDMNNDRQDIDDFVEECAPYLGKAGLSIPNEKAQNLFDKFLELFYR